MQAVLNQINTLQGMVGCMVFDAEGQVLAQAFPALFVTESLASAAGILVNGAAGLETATGKISMMDLRYGESRIVIRPLTGASLLLFCTAQANLQFLNISIGVAIPKIEKLVASQPATARPSAPAPPATAAAGQVAQAKPAETAKESLATKAEELKGFEKAFMKMDSWLRR